MGFRLPFSRCCTNSTQSFSSLLHPFCHSTPSSHSHFYPVPLWAKASLEFPINLTPFASITGIKRSHRASTESIPPSPPHPTFNQLNSPQQPAVFIINYVGHILFRNWDILMRQLHTIYVIIWWEYHTVATKEVSRARIKRAPRSFKHTLIK